MTHSLHGPMLLARTAVAATLSSIPLIMMATEEWRVVYGLVLGILTILILAGAFDEVPLDRMGRVGSASLLLVVPILLSTLVNQPEDTRLENLAVIGCYALFSPLILQAPLEQTTRQWAGMVILGMMIAGYTVLAVTADSGVWDAITDRRGSFDFESANLHPNFIGLMCTVMAVAAAGLRSSILMSSTFALAFFAAWIVSSRAAILAIATAAACAIFGRFTGPSTPESRRNSILMAVGALVVTLFLALNTSAIEFLQDEVLLIDDTNRGASSGFTSRTELWQASWSLWTENMVFGVGYGQHTDLLGLGTYAHNIVLILLADTGILGLAGFVWFSHITLRDSRDLFRSGQHSAAIYLLTNVAVYWVYGIFEGRAVNAGNPLSALFFMLAFAGMTWVSGTRPVPGRAPAESADR
jgi:O-antigen ligase